MGNRLQTLRREAGYTSARAFAEHIGMPVTTYTNYEQRDSGLYLDAACVIADGLGCTLDELAGHVVSKTPIQSAYDALNDEGRERLMEQAMFLKQRYSRDMFLSPGNQAV